MCPFTTSLSIAIQIAVFFIVTKLENTRHFPERKYNLDA
jgi:hypothetical protein